MDSKCEQFGMKHFLITRFNLRNSDWINARDGEKVLTPEWLNHRFELFENNTLRSVKNQINQNFSWLVFFDINTPNHYRKWIQKIDKSYDNFIPVFIDGLEYLASSTEVEVFKRLDNNDDFVITTRLDNDDLIHEKFIEKLQSAFIPKHKTIIDARLGYQMILEDSKAEYRLFKKAYNPFLSVISNVSNFESAVSRSHHQWQAISNLIALNDQPLWIQLVHHKNMVARENKSLKIVQAPNNQHFGVTLAPSKNSAFRNKINNYIRLPERILYQLKMKFRH